MHKHKRVVSTVIICQFLASVASIVCNAHDQDVAPLIQQLELTVADVQYSAHQSLAEIGEEVVPALMQAAADKNGHVGHLMAFALKAVEDFEHTLNEKTVINVQKSK